MSSYIDASLRGGTLRISRLGRCPTTGEWCTSTCYAYSLPPGHPNWIKVLERPYPVEGEIAAFIRELRPLLLTGENHNIDAEHLVNGGASVGGDWEWIDRGYDLDDKEKVDAWLRRLRRLLQDHKRLRLYGDDHPIAVTA